MIYYGGDKPLVSRVKKLPNNLWWVVTEVYRGAQLVWSAVKSCFGKGYWIEDKPWLDNDIWKNNK